MTLHTLQKYTTKKEAQRFVNVIREHVQPINVKVEGGEINGFDIFEVRDKLNELVRNREITLKNWTAYNSWYDLVIAMIEEGAV